MIKKEKEIKLLDLIDIELLQEIQDNFAKTMGIASLICDTKGPVTKPSNFTDFCEYTRANGIGAKKCIKCNLQWGEDSIKKNEIEFYNCDAGLGHFVFPIMVEGRHLGSFLSGQFLFTPPDEDKIRKVAREIGIDENKYIEAIRKIKVVPEDNIKSAANLLRIVTNTISEIANKNLKLIRKNEREKEIAKKEKQIAKREKLLRKTIEKIGSSLNLEQVQHEIVNQVGKQMKAARVNIGYYDSKLQDYIVSKESEYKPSDKVKSMARGSFKSIPDFTEAVKNTHLKGQDIIFSNLEKYLDEKKLKGTGVEKFYKEYDFVSSAAINIYCKDKFWGNLIVAFNEPRKITQNEIKLLKEFASQAGGALCHAELYKKTFNQAEREKFIRKTIELLRNSVESNIIKNLLVTKVGEYFNADRVFFSDFDSEKNIYLPIEKNSEFLSNPNEKSFVGFDWSNEAINEYIQPLLEYMELNIPCWNEYTEKAQKGKGFISRFEDMNVKSSYSVPIIYENKNMGFLCIEFTKNSCINLSDDDIAGIKVICTQCGFALNHCEWYAKAKKSLESIGDL